MSPRTVISKRLVRADALVLGWFEDQKIASHPWWPKLPRSLRSAIQKNLKRPNAGREWGNSIVMQLPKGQWPNLVIAGLGRRADWSDRRNRLLTRRLVRQALANRWPVLAIAFQKLTAADAQLVAENALLGAYEYRRHKQAPKTGWPELNRLIFIARDASVEHAAAARRGVTIGERVNDARDLANTPGGLMTPKRLAAAAVKIARGRKLRVKVLTPAHMEKLGMGALLGVGQGSDEPPRLIVIEYVGTRTSEQPLVFVGKGITFDSGGYNLKPSQAMTEMHMDMAGGAAVIGALAAIADLALPVNVVGIVPAAENMVSGSGFRPGDILKSMSGLHIEINNTDAEGRLVLADGLTYAQKTYSPKMLVDVATLTGAALVALGQEAAALLTKSKDWETRGQEIGESSGDYVWPLPMWEEYDQLVKATFGDVSNAGKMRWGGTIEGGIFLSKFVKEVPWVHLDIAPTMSSIDGQHLAPGATGAGVRWLIELARREARNA